ncbi:26S proteasome non-ATPase regulatory subunit 4 [Histomonas meleagridis]|uniref:26S proteasome non-ATPase regulatory subunit 4 n=1 Tax=Histomonas meleagridis TaxID=135588 RepID=UPI00355A03B2|nr:26S proteasome non-ATPase regulatory subunit 4 [Histomonas meleagridis]KAH0806213.1 26S proteasome non-ATPase regulatory subunit 4 [Histomonas meleagridis]
MEKNEPKAIMILIDNSDMSINGDFYPDRLSAQLEAAGGLIHIYIKNSDVGIGVLAKGGPIVVSLCKNYNNYNNVISKLQEKLGKIQTGGSAKLVQAIRCAYLTLKNSEIKNRQVIAFIGSPNDLEESHCQKLFEEAKDNQISVSFVVMGNDVPNEYILENLVQSLQKSYTDAGKPNMLNVLIHATPFNMLLSDTVLSSPLNPSGNPDLIEDDIELEMALKMSREEASNEEIQKAIEESLKTSDRLNDPDIQDALMMGSRENNQNPDKSDSNNGQNQNQ